MDLFLSNIKMVYFPPFERFVHGEEGEGDEPQTW